VLVMDIRHPMKPFDEMMLNWCAATGLPCHVLMTKADKLKRGPAQSALLKLQRTLPEGASAQVFSSKNRTGLDQWLRVMRDWFELPD
jgi:GTP-binding protein